MAAITPRMNTSQASRKPGVVAPTVARPVVTAPPPSVPPPGTLPSAPISNWNGEVVSKPRAVYTPVRDAEIIQIMTSEKKVRVSGAMHSFNEQLFVDRDTALINMTHFNRVGEPQRLAGGSATIWVEAGALVKDVSTALHRHGLALENLPSLEYITVGGAIANGVHGSGLTSPATLAEQVIGMEVITSAGEKKVVSEAELPVYRINLGSLGVVTRVQLKCVPDFDMVTNDGKIVGEDAVVAALEHKRLLADVGAQQSVTYFFNPNLADPTKTTLVSWGMTRATAEQSRAAEGEGLQRKVNYDGRGSLGTFAVFKAYERAANATGASASEVKAFLRDRFQPRERRIGRSALMYQMHLDHPSHDVSYGVPLERAQEAFVRVMKKMRELNYEAPIPMGMRFLKGTDKTLVGMNSGRDVAVFEIFTSVLFDDTTTGALRDDVKAAHEAFEAIMIELGGRPHWAKEFFVNPRSRHDPRAWQRFATESAAVGGKLVNAWAKQMTPAGGA